MNTAGFSKLRVCFVAILIGYSSIAVAREAGSKAAYARADELFQTTRDTVFKAGVRAEWIGETPQFWYRIELAEGVREYVLIDAESNVRRPAFDHKRLALALEEMTDNSYDATRLMLDEFSMTEDGAIHFKVESRTYRFSPECELTETEKSISPSAPHQPNSSQNQGRQRGSREASRENTSPDGRFSVVVRDHNLVLRETDGGQETTLSFDGCDVDGYQSNVLWSPDSRSFIAQRRTKGSDHKIHMVESSPKDQTQPTLVTHEYLKPGDQIAITRTRLFNVESAREIPIEPDLAPNPWSVDRFQWEPDSSRFTFLYNQRGHQVMRLIAVDAKTGKASAVVDEKTDTFFCYSSKLFERRIPASRDLIWMSERDGWNHLYLINADDGTVKNQITRGPWVVRDVDHVDEVNRRIWFRLGGIHTEQDPYHIHYARVDFDGNNLVVLTAGDGTHEVAFSPDRSYYLDTYSRVDLPPVTELRRSSDGSLIREIERADVSRLEATGWTPPERFVAKGRDGETDIYGIICRPRSYDSANSYPVIEHIYAGPHGSFVPKSFSTFHHHQALAELGFIVVQIDGMGTNHRSKAFHDVAWKNLVDSGFPDRILWIKAAAEKDPAMDLSRVGIYGGSAGGQSALAALLTHGDFYKAAAADCGCHDNRMDKIWWNEQWMGWPVGPHYAAQSNVTLAPNLKGKLLLTVGELDRNVDPASTMQVVNALIKADKDFELIVFPGANHGIGESPYGNRRRRDFFVRHLLGVEPRAE